jgi:uracil-DNA glycosylase
MSQSGLVVMFFVSNPNGIEGTLNAMPASSFRRRMIFSNGIRKTPMTTAPASLKTMREEAANCRACHLWKHATQTVFGEGPQAAQLMLVGEQPGDKEDLAGKPFVETRDQT